jgi:hypothetical protein
MSIGESCLTIQLCLLSHISFHLSMALQPLWTLITFQFLNLHTVGRSPWTGDQPVARPLPTHRTTQTQNKRTQSSMPLVGFEPMAPVFERAKTVHALDRVATVIGFSFIRTSKECNNRYGVKIKNIEINYDKKLLTE